MNATSSCALVSVLAVVAGCATHPVPPLLFGEVTTVGIDIGAGPDSDGVDLTLGFKAVDVAVIPVSAVSKGEIQSIDAWNRDKDGGRRDALSVFGQFTGRAENLGSGETPKTARKITLGRFFATGLAADRLAEGYKKGWAGENPQDDNTPQPPVQPQADARVTARPQPPAPATTQDEEHTKPYAPPLVFAQSDTLGIGISTSLAQQGTHFTLGYTGRDIAFVPVMALAPDGQLKRLGGIDNTGPDGKPAPQYQKWRESNAFSVLGQFKVDTDTTSVDFGLRRFFATGLAARRLAEGFKEAIANDLTSHQQNPGSPGGSQ